MDVGKYIPPNNNEESKQHEYDSTFECNICLETAKDAVVSMCGHLFCWPCLHQWLSTVTNSNTQSHKTCPVCKAAISRDKVIPIYGRGGDETNKQDPRDKLPPRPQGQRTEVPYNNQNQFIYGNVWTAAGPGGQIFSFGDSGFHMSFGVGAFPQNIINCLLTLLHELSINNDTMVDIYSFIGSWFFLLMGIGSLLMAVTTSLS